MDPATIFDLIEINLKCRVLFLKLFSLYSNSGDEMLHKLSNVHISLLIEQPCSALNIPDEPLTYSDLKREIPSIFISTL